MTIEPTELRVTAEESATDVPARATAWVSTRPLFPTSSMADCVRLPTILWVEASIASAPSASGERGRRA